MYVQLCIGWLASFCFMPKHQICHCSKASQKGVNLFLEMHAAVGWLSWEAASDENWCAGGL